MTRTHGRNLSAPNTTTSVKFTALWTRGFTHILFCCLFCASAQAQEIVVGSKKFTESVVWRYGCGVSQSGSSVNASVTHRRELGGTRVLWNALIKGEVDLYPDYTGTLSREILAGENLRMKRIFALGWQRWTL